MFRLIVLILLLTLLIPGGKVLADILNVPDDFETIQAAINEAEDSDTVLVQPGEYVENINFEGRNIVVIGNPDDPSEVVIDGDENGSVVTFVNEETEAAELVGFTIQNGAVDGSGGGIHISNSSPTIRNCVIQGNQAGASGGGILVSQDCNPLITNCQIMDNISVGNGGGITVERQATPVIDNCLLVYNETDGNGGAIAAIDNASPVVLNCTFDWEGRWGWYTAIYLAASNVRVVNSIIYGPSPLWISFDPDSDESGLMIAYSDIQDGQESIVTNDNGEVQWEEGNIDEEPLFVDREEGDYHLTEDSPCIDAGDPESPEDPDSTRADMGAYYFHQIGQYIDVPIDYETIQEAIDAAEDGDTVLVHPGTYVENIDFIGKDIVVGSLFLTTENAAYVDSTIIDGNANGTVVTFANEETEAAELIGFTVQHGMTDGNGGGIHIFSSSPIISNCVIFANSADHKGGGVIVSQECNPIINECLIWFNESSDNGGGITVEREAKPVFINCTIMRNHTNGDGGSVACLESAEPIMINCTVTQNTFMEGSGAIFLSASDMILLNSIVWYNDGFLMSPTILFDPDSAACSITIAFSDIDGGEEEIQTSNNGEVNWLNGNIDEDPLFADDVNRDFNLSEGSPCIDAGIAFFVWEQDTLVNLTPDDYIGNAPDMGAFESEFTDVEDGHVELPDEFRLHPAFPNPFNSATELRFDLPIASRVTLKIYDLIGREALILTDNAFVAGRYRLTWNASEMPSGIYLARFEASGYKQTAKLVLVR